MAVHSLTKKKPEKGLLRPLNKTGGRNNTGRITIRHRGGGAKRRYRLVEFGQKNEGMKGVVKALEYDPNRTCHIALVEYEDGSRHYVLAPRELAEGNEVMCAEEAAPNPGNRMKLKNIPLGTVIFNIEMTPNRGGVLVRSAGGSARILASEGKYVLVELPSKEHRYVLGECYATIGDLSNPEHRYQRLKNAGASRRRGRRPQVRGSAMNPVDHPHGGGEGRQSIGLKHPKTPWGKPALGVKTRGKKASDRLIIKKRKNKDK